MVGRKPQINFQVESAMKRLYEEAKKDGHWVTRLCAAGFLLMVEDPIQRHRALARLREWEAAFGNASPEEIRLFVQGAQTAMLPALRGTAPARKARRRRKKAIRPGSE